MDLLLMFVIATFSLSIGFVFGAWWCAVGRINKSFEEEFAKEIKENKIKVCDRCGSRFEKETSEDENVCQTCVNYLKENPDDEYIQNWRYE